jgi:hypothetical protein
MLTSTIKREYHPEIAHAHPEQIALCRKFAHMDHRGHVNQAGNRCVYALLLRPFELSQLADGPW